jgi:hypothetical protein
MFKGAFAGVAALAVAGSAFAGDAGDKATSNEAPLAAVAEVAALQLCVAWATTGEAPAAFQPDLAQDVYDLQPGSFELGRFGKITTATGDLRIAVFPQEKVCRVGVGDASVADVKAQLLATLKAPDSGWQETATKDENGAWRVQFTAQGGDRPVKLAVNGYDAPRDGGRGRQLVVTVGETLVD